MKMDIKIEYNKDAGNYRVFASEGGNNLIPGVYCDNLYEARVWIDGLLQGFRCAKSLMSRISVNGDHYDAMNTLEREADDRLQISEQFSVTDIYDRGGFIKS